MKIKSILLAALLVLQNFISTHSIATTTTTTPPSTTVPSTSSGVLPQSLRVAGQGQAAKSNILMVVAQCAAIAAAMGCAPACMPLAAVCAGFGNGAASRVGNTISSAGNSIDATETNTPYNTAYNRPTLSSLTPDSGVKPGQKPDPAKKPLVINTGDGRSFPVSSLGSDSAMSKAGYSQKETDLFRKMAKEMDKRISNAIAKSAQDKADSSESESLGSRKTNARLDNVDMPVFAMPRDPSAVRAEAQALGKAGAIGLAKRCGDSFCGTANDGIFHMINRQMIKQCNHNTLQCQ